MDTHRSVTADQLANALARIEGEDVNAGELRGDASDDADAPALPAVSAEERASPRGGDGDSDFEVDRPDRAERMHIERIRELDFEQLEVEEVDSDGEGAHSDDSSMDGRGDGGAGPRGGFTFDTSLAGLHTYLGEVDDIANVSPYLDGGALLTLPMFYLEGIVLFPDDTLPLRVLQPRFKAAMERAIRQSEARNTLGVIHVPARTRGSGMQVPSVGTTAEVRQLKRLNDGSMNVVTRGRQRFRIRKAWTEPDGALCAQVQIIEEDVPMHLPRGAFGNLASVPSLQSGKVPRVSLDSEDASEDEALQPVSSERNYFDDDDSDSAQEDQTSVPPGQPAPDIGQVSRHGEQGLGEESSEEEERLRWWWWLRRGGRNSVSRHSLGETRRRVRNELEEDSLEANRHGESSAAVDVLPEGSNLSKRSRMEHGWGGPCRSWAADERKWLYRAQLSTWPHWVYRMYDAYDLARRAADMLRQMAELPRMDDMVRDPTALSFYIASNIPLQDSTRQELLEIHSALHRLKREIQLLESMDQLRCKTCPAVIARRSNLLVMSSDGPISAYVNAYGDVHETLTLSRAPGLVLHGPPDTTNSWFPGYAWTIAYCSNCERHMGWRFTAVKKGMQPKAFWGVRRSQLAESNT